ncbi:uncharacterized protein LOC142349214 isoform X2 [Convolutriloba macropyga]|uniref:uncharacterized protein LOC142349214 isoform X2 n=1 Tax=Convolutriloba macropyga TaxID=536237 RepID=UPI003F51F212
MSVSFPLVVTSIEPFAIHFLVVISNLSNFEQQSSVNTFETDLVHKFNDVITSYLGYHKPRRASTAQVVKVETGVKQSGDIYDVMVVFTDSYGEHISEETSYEEIFAGREGETSNATGYQILGVSKTDFTRESCDTCDNEEDSETSVWRIVALVAIAFSVFLMLVCCVQCCRECFCGEKRSVIPATFDNSNLTVDLERGRVRQLTSAEQPTSISSRQESIMSSVSRRPLVNTEFVPVTRNNLLHVRGNDTISEQYFQESEILSLATDVCETSSAIIAKDVNADIINGYSNRKVDFQRTGSFPRSRKLTLYEKSLIHEAALPPLEEEQLKGAQIVRKSSSLQNLIKVVGASESLKGGRTNPGFADDDKKEVEADNQSLFEEVEDLDRAKPSFDESIAAFQNLEGRGVSDYTRTLPSRMRRVRSLTEISDELNKSNADSAKNVSENYASVEPKKSSSIGNILEEKPFFSRFFS